MKEIVMRLCYGVCLWCCWRQPQKWRPPNKFHNFNKHNFPIKSSKSCKYLIFFITVIIPCNTVIFYLTVLTHFKKQKLIIR